MTDPKAGILTDKLGIIHCIKCGVELDVSEYAIFDSIVCPNCSAKQTVPAKLGNFLLRSVIGQGGMGTVYLARDESLGREVALKVLRAEYGSDPKSYDQLVHEAQAAASLNHAHVVQIYSFGLEKGQPYIVMELVNGGRLDQLMENNARVDEMVVLETAIDICKGLEAAYDGGLIHGDIKPANILYDKSGNAKVVDFGLAKFEGSSHAKGEIWGTPYYIAPEKARGKNEDFRSDQYSLGATLYHALAGKPPFDGKSATDVVVARLKGDAPRVNEINPGVGEMTAAVIARMMDSTPPRRYPTYSSLLADLEEAMAAARQSTRQRDRAHVKAPSKNKTLPLVISLVVALAAGGVAAFYLLKDKKNTPGPAPTGAAALAPLPPYDPPAVTDTTPFLRGASIELTRSMTFYKPGAYMRTFTGIAGIATNQAKINNRVGAAWLNLFQGIILVLEDDTQSLNTTLRPLIAQGVRFNSPAAPIESPVTLARFLLGLVSEKTLLESTARAEPWFADLRDFLIALQAAKSGKTTRVAEFTANYNSRRQSNHWAYAFRPHSVALATQASKTGNKDLSTLDPATKAATLAEIMAAGGFPFWKKL